MTGIGDRLYTGIGDQLHRNAHPVPEGADVRSCQVVETTREGTPPEKKRYRVHLQLGSPVPKTRRRRQVGLDLGVRHAVATSDGRFFDRPDVSPLLEEAKRIVEHARKHCTRDSRAWNRHHAKARELRRQARLIQDHWEWAVAKGLVTGAGLLGMESLKLRNMMASGRGTSSAPGSQGKHGLNNAIAVARLGAVARKIEREALKHGTHLVKVHPGGTSITCNPCRHRDPESRDGEAFVCSACAHEDHADTNASKNIRDRSVNAWTGYRKRQEEKKTRAPGDWGSQGQQWGSLGSSGQWRWRTTPCCASSQRGIAPKAHEGDGDRSA